MNSNNPATLLIPAKYDDCRIVSCLKKLFTMKASPVIVGATAGSKVKADFIVSTGVAEVKKELELVNRAGIRELSYDYLAAMEQSLPGVSFRYAVIYRDDEPVLFAYFQLFTLTSRNFNLEKNKGFVKRILGFFLDMKKARVLISGNALRNETAGFCFDENVLSIDKAIEIIASAGEKIAADENAAALIIKDIAVSPHARQKLAGNGFEMPWQDMAMTLEIKEDWATLTDYCNDLSRKYKARAKKILAAGSVLDIRTLEEEEIQHYDGEIHRLFKNVADNQSFVLTKLGANHFSLLKQLYGSNFEVVGFFRNGKLVAFYTAFNTPDAYELYYVGFDYQLNNEFHLYFNILFSGLERAILLNKKRLKLGRTSFDAKASMGAKPVEMEYFYKPGNIPDAVSKWFVNYFSTMEDGKWKLRNPMK